MVRFGERHFQGGAVPELHLGRLPAGDEAQFVDRALAELLPITAGWYSGADPWSSCYGPDLHLATDATRFDVSPAQAFAVLRRISQARNIKLNRVAEELVRTRETPT